MWISSIVICYPPPTDPVAHSGGPMRCRNDPKVSFWTFVEVLVLCVLRRYPENNSHSFDYLLVNNHAQVHPSSVCNLCHQIYAKSLHNLDLPSWKFILIYYIDFEPMSACEGHSSARVQSLGECSGPIWQVSIVFQLHDLPWVIYLPCHCYGLDEVWVNLERQSPLAQCLNRASIQLPSPHRINSTGPEYSFPLPFGTWAKLVKKKKNGQGLKFMW